MLSWGGPDSGRCPGCGVWGTMPCLLPAFSRCLRGRGLLAQHHVLACAHDVSGFVDADARVRRLLLLLLPAEHHFTASLGIKGPFFPVMSVLCTNREVVDSMSTPAHPPSVAG